MTGRSRRARTGSTPAAATLGGLAGLAWLALTVATAHEVDPPPDEPPAGGASLSHVPCVDGFADVFPCENVEIEALLPVSEFGASSLNDVWGWVDPVTDVEYALVGADTGTFFVDLSDPHDPIIVGELPSHSVSSQWRDVRVYADHALVVSEALDHGMQVFDLSRLRAVATPPVVFGEDAHFDGFSDAHNVSVNLETGFAYAVGASSCGRGLTMIDVLAPLAPSLAGCFADDGYTHDVQCVVYQGPDVDYQGREICFASNVDTVTLVDVTDKSSPMMLSRTSYPNVEYVHQGWISDDHHHYFHNDELDERDLGQPTRTHVWELSDLEAPSYLGYHEHPTSAIDHNLFVLGDHLVQAHYRAGVRVNRFGDLTTPALAQVAYLDTDPASDAATFSGVWGVYPYLPSGLVLASDIYTGLFVLRPELDAVADCEDGLDNDGDGFTDFPADLGCWGPDALNERPQCQDGLDNDGDGGTDWNGAPADPQCALPWDIEPAPFSSCGLGAELTLVLPLLLGGRARRRRRAGRDQGRSGRPPA